MAPTVYVCAQDRGDDAAATIEGDERLLVLINAPPDGDISAFSDEDISDYESRAFELLVACGLEIEKRSDASVVTTPGVFNDLFPATGGALYGRASHGSNATFQRPAAVSRIAGLYFAGGSVHPGPGVPMAAMSGRLTAARVIEDLSAHRERRRSVSVMTIPVPTT